MQHLVFHFDPISPFVYLAFHRLPEELQGCSYSVEYRPVLFAGLLKHWGHKGPAEIEPKRAWTFRTCGYGHGHEFWKPFVSMLRRHGYDHVLSIEHEDPLMSVEEGLERAVFFLQEAIISEQPGKPWWH